MTEKLDPKDPNVEVVEVVDDEYRKPNPQDNPRNIALGEIAKKVAEQHVADAAEKAILVDDDGVPTEPPPAASPEEEPAPAAAADAEPPVSEPAPAAEPAPAGGPAAGLDPNAEYEITVHGEKMKVKGQTIIDAGFSTMQKGAEADFRLKVASQLLEEAERRHAASTTPSGGVTEPAKGAQPAGSKTEAELAQMLQFGTPEQSAEAVRILKAGGATEERILGLVQEASRAAAKDEIEFQQAKGFLQREFGDVMQKEPLRNLFFSEEARLRQAGDRRSYRELYKAIGENIRKDFSLPKPAAAASANQAPQPGTAEARKVAKAAAPAVPRTAAARLQRASSTKPKSNSEIIAAMAATRGKNRLAEPKEIAMAGQIWAVNSLGGFFYSQNLSDELREALQPMSRFRQLCDVKDASQQGKGKGQTFTWDVVSDMSTAGGTLVETKNTMPETQFTITQATLTVNEYGNSVPYSGKLEALSKFEVRKPVMQALRNDAVKVFDRAAWIQFNNAKLRVVPATAGTSTTVLTLTTNGTATATNNIAFQKEHCKLVVDTMKERNIPAYTNDDYVGIAWPTTLRKLKNDLEAIHQYTVPGIQLIFNAEIGRYENVRFIEQTNIVKGFGSTDGISSTAWASGNDWIFFIGEDTVAEGVVIPEEMRAKIPTDYGRSKGVAYYYLGGFGIVQTAASQSRIVVWDSAA